MKFEWEPIYMIETENTMEMLKRAKVFGGWIVEKMTLIHKTPMNSVIFVPDPNHEWTIDE